MNQVQTFQSECSQGGFKGVRLANTSSDTCHWRKSLVTSVLAGGCLALVSLVGFTQDTKVLVVHGYVPPQCTLYLNGQAVSMLTFSLADDLSNEQSMVLGELEFDCNHRGPVELLTSVMPPHGNGEAQQIRPLVQLSYAGHVYRADPYGYLYVSHIDQPITLSVVNTHSDAVVAGVYRAYLQVLGD